MRENRPRRRGAGALALLAVASASAAASGPLPLRLLPPPVSMGVRSALSNSPFRRAAGTALSSSSSSGARSCGARRAASNDADLERCGLRLVGATGPGEERGYDVLALDDDEEEGLRSVCGRALVGSEGPQKDVRLCRAAAVRSPPAAASKASVVAAAAAVGGRQGEGTEGTAAAAASAVSAGGAAFPTRRLHFWENMVCGAISRSVAQTIMHPANTMKTILQSNRAGAASGSAATTIRELIHPSNYRRLFTGAGAQFTLSVPHGAVNFAVLEYVRRRMNNFVSEREVLGQRMDSQKFGPALDFLSSCISTFCCSVVSTPQMMVTDNIMAGTYPNLPAAVRGLAAERGVAGFYTGWWPGLAGKIPSYALTWTFFQQLKEAQLRVFKRPPRDIENSVMGCMASATTVCIMIPMDTIKTRLVTQLNYPDLVPYKGIGDAAVRIAREEGMGAFYRGLTPRLVSVVPMIGIQFGVYEFMKKVMLSRTAGEEMAGGAPLSDGARKKYEERMKRILRMEKKRNLEEVAMEVAADDEQPFPAPHFDEEKFRELEKKAEKEAGVAAPSR